MIDIHSHILPGLDDGPAGLEEALEMVREAARAGVSSIVTTPHAFSPWCDISPIERDRALESFSRELTAADIPVKLFPGFECFTVTDLIDRIKDDPAYFMPDFTGNGRSRRVLIELGNANPVKCMDSLLFQCQEQDITPIWAHPERHPEAARDPGVVESFVWKGGELQITADSLAGSRYSRSRQVCEFLMKKNLVTYIASDAHCREDYAIWRKALRRAGKITP